MDTNIHSYTLEDAVRDAKNEIMITEKNQTYSIHSNNEAMESLQNLMLTARVLDFAESVTGSVECLEKGQVKEIEKEVEELSMITNLSELKQLLPTTRKSTESLEDEGMVSSQDFTIKQLQKDVERDILCINGMFVSVCEYMFIAFLGRFINANNNILYTLSNIVHVGVKMLGGRGLGFVLDEMLKAIDIACASCNKHPSCLSFRRKQDFSMYSLQKVARTNSGGQSFSAIQSLVDLSSTLVVPQSSLASPLLINIHLGDHHGVIGIKSMVTTETIFELKDITAEEITSEDNDDAGNEKTDQNSINHEGKNIDSESSSLLLSVQYENFVFVPIPIRSFDGEDCDHDDDLSGKSQSPSNFKYNSKDDAFSSYQTASKSKQRIVVGPGLLKLRRHLI